MVATDQVAENRAAGADRSGIILAAIAALTLLVHWGLADFNPKPYGTLPIDGSVVPLFAPAGGSPVLIFAVAALLLFARRARLMRALGDPPLRALGLTLLAGAATIERWADYVDTPELLIPSLILILLGAGAVLGGRRGLSAISVPALFLIFAIPVPSGIVNLVVWPLQLSTAESAETFLRMIGYMPERFAEIVVLGGHAFHVVETCSGMRTIETLIMAGSLYSILFYRRPAQVVLILLMAPIFGYCVNLVRVLSIIFNPYAEYDSVHTLQGVVMLVVGVLLIAGFDNLLRRLEERMAAAPRRRNRDVETHAAVSWSRPTGVVLLLVILALCNALIPQWQPEPAPDPRALRLPTVLAESKPKGLRLDRQFLGSVGVTKWLNREYAYLDSNVQIQILADDRLNRRGSLISRKTAIPGRGSVESSHDRVQLTQGALVDRYLFRNRNHQTLVYHWYEGTSSRIYEIIRNALALDRGPTRRNHWALAVRLSTVVAEDDVAGIARADARLRGFAMVVHNALK
ncbi:MAG: archaeosortase/exosortase family protein [Deltaproteobacteria bacterium]|nr:archaeosortase/exosortase family protein [Deltaproteobacteria bacterium]